MGNNQSETASQGDGPGRPVWLNVYEPIRDDGLKVEQMPGFGIYHTGVEIDGEEWAFLGSNSSSTGILKQLPKWQPPGSPWNFKQTLQLGVTRLSPPQVQSVLQALGKEFPGNSYHMTSRNCNHFSEAFCKRLTSKSIPSWVNRAAKIGDRFKGMLGDTNDPMTGGGAASGQDVDDSQARFDFTASQGHSLAESGASDKAQVQQIAKVLGSAGKLSAPVDPEKPVASMRVVFHNRQHAVIKLNLTHTVDDLYVQVRQSTPELPAPNTAFQLSTGFPPKPLLVSLQTIEEARLDRASLQQTLI